jgi:hypothetical protein
MKSHTKKYNLLKVKIIFNNRATEYSKEKTVSYTNSSIKIQMTEVILLVVLANEVVVVLVYDPVQ